MLLTAILIWLVVANITGLVICALDKHRARKRKWRIPEKTIFSIALIGGSIGVYAALLLLRHKTRHLRFMLGVPVIFVIQALVAACLMLRV